jgi:hypothetical protein
MSAAQQIPFDYHTYFAQFHSLLELPAIRETISCLQALNEKIQNTVIETFKEIHEHLKPVPFNSIILKMNEIGSNIERGFNIAATVPFIGTMTSAIRITLAKILFLAGAIFASVIESIHFIASKAGADNELLYLLRTLSTLGLEYMIHGCLNVIRGASELMIGACTFGLGSVVLIIPNMAAGRNFTPFFGYGSLVNERIDKDAEEVIKCVIDT